MNKFYVPMIWTLFGLDTFEVVSIVLFAIVFILHNRTFKKELDAVKAIVEEMRKLVVNQFKIYNSTIEDLRTDKQRLLKENTKLKNKLKLNP